MTSRTLTDAERDLMSHVAREEERKGLGTWVDCRNRLHVAASLAHKGLLEDDGKSGTLFRRKT